MANSDRFLDLRPEAPAETIAVCPKCRSGDIASAAKHPTAGSYWSCGSCGGVWTSRELSAERAPGHRAAAREARTATTPRGERGH